MPPSWDDEYMIPLLQSYRRNECLWNNTLKDYSNTVKRANAIARVVEDLRPHLRAADLHLLDADRVAKKLNSTRTAYRRELKKIEESERSGAGANDIYVPKLVWFNLADTFLRRACRPTPSISNLRVSIESYCMKDTSS